MTEFQTAQCPRCGGDPSDDVPILSEEIPGATIVNRFCSAKCRQEYVDQRLEDGTAYETIADQLTDAGMNPVAFDEAVDDSEGDIDENRDGGESNEE